MSEAREIETCGEIQKPVAEEVGRESESGGLLNLPTLPLLAVVHVYC